MGEEKQEELKMPPPPLENELMANPTTLSIAVLSTSPSSIEMADVDDEIKEKNVEIKAKNNTPGYRILFIWFSVLNFSYIYFRRILTTPLLKQNYASSDKESAVLDDVPSRLLPAAPTIKRAVSNPFMQQATSIRKKGIAFFQGLVGDWSPRNASDLSSLPETGSGFKRELRLNEYKTEWQEILQKWKKTPLKKVRSLCWRGIPPSIRCEAWKTIIGNELKITPDLFRILSAQAEAAAERFVAKPNSPTDGREESIAIIEVDAPRTFPELKFFHGDGPLRKPLLKILRTYVRFRPDIGYIQGMSYIAAMLLLNLDSEVSAFIALANLLNREMYFRLFQDFRSGSKHLNVFERLLDKHLPRIAQRFKQIGVISSMYLYDWILTIFSRSFPLDVSCRIWDNFLIDGSVFVFRAALGIIKLYSPALCQSSFEQCLNLLNHIPKNLNVEEFFECIASIAISPKHFQQELDKELIDIN